MRKRLVAFELTDREIRAFWFSLHSFRKQSHISNAVKFDRIPIPVGAIEQGNVRNEKVVIDSLMTYGAECLDKSRKVYLAIPLYQGFIRSYRLPWISQWDRKSAISLLVDEEISIARSDLLYDYLVLSEEKHKGLQILLGATRQSLMEQYVSIFERAGFRVNGADFSFSILGQSLGFEQNEDVLYLQEESGSFQVALFRGAVPESVRSLRTQANEENIIEWTEESENEIRRFLLYYKTQHPDLNLKRLVWNGNSAAELLAQSLLASNYVSIVERAKLRNVPDSWRKVLEGDIAGGEVAVGYGVRIAAQCSGLNLWHQPNLSQTIQRRYRGLAFFLGILFMIGTMSGILLSQMALPLEKEVQQIAHQGVKIEAQAKQAKDLEIAWNKEKTHAEKIGEGLAEIQLMQALPGAGLTIKQVIYKQGSMSLRGSANEARDVEGLIHRLQAMGWEQPALSSYKMTSLHNIEFVLSAKHGRVGMEQEDKMIDSSVVGE